MVETYKIDLLDCLGVSIPNIEVQVYDFLAHGITSNYDGVIGLDVLRRYRFCIDAKRGVISFEIYVSNLLWCLSLESNMN